MRRIFDYFRWRKASGEHDAPEELNEDRARDTPRAIASTPPERTSTRKEELARLKRRANLKHKRKSKRR